LQRPNNMHLQRTSGYTARYVLYVLKRTDIIGNSVMLEKQIALSAYKMSVAAVAG